MRSLRALHVSALFILAACLCLVLSVFGISSASAASGQIGDFAFRGEPGLFIVHSDGTGLRQLTFKYNDYSPAWSPDGHSVAFTRDGSLWVLALGHAPRRITAGSDPTWSPDGRRLAYTKIVSGSLSDIFVVPASGGTPKRLSYFAAGGCSGSQPTWSPLGPIAFIRTPVTGTCVGGVVEKTLADSRVHILVPDATASDPAYTADGRHLLYQTPCDIESGICNSNGQVGWETTAAGTRTTSCPVSTDAKRVSPASNPWFR